MLEYGTFANTAPVTNPLIWHVETNSTYSDGSNFNYEIDYNLTAKINWEEPCLYYKATSEFEFRFAKCDNTYAFVCKWSSKFVYKQTNK